MPTASSPVASRDKLLKAYRGLAHLFPLLVLVQAWIAGNAVYGDADITIHGIIGNISYLVAVAVLVLTLVARANKGAVTVAAVLVVLMTVQIGLGYSADGGLGSDPDSIAAWHVFLGVVVFGLAVYQVSLATSLLKGSLTAER